MSDFSLTLVLQFKTSKIINDKAKVQIKSEKVTPFGGIFHVRELFSRYMAPIIDKVLGLRCASYGYQYSEIIRAVFSVFCCGGDCMEDLNLYLKDVLTERKGEQLDLFDGEYTYRCILTNDWDMTDEEIIQHYNKRGTAEQVFDRQNNDFGWAHLPKSFMNQNTVFLLITAMAANFYRYIVALPLMAVLFGIKATDRVKSFLFRFIAVPAKWVRTARQYKLNIYSNKPYKLIWEHG